MAQQIQFRRDTSANWAANNPILAQGEFGLETNTSQFKVGDGTTAWNSLAYGGIQGPAQTQPIYGYGTGQDGDVSLSAGITTLTRNMYYNNLTLSGTAQIVLAGFKIFVKDTLNLDNAGNHAINWNGVNGTSATTQVGGAAGTALATATNGGSTAGSAGGTGVVGVGAASAAATVASPANGGASGASGAGGAGGSGAGGAAGASVIPTLPSPVNHFQTDLTRGAALLLGGNGARGGGSGAGDGVVLGRGGGGGGGGAGVVQIFARRISRGASTSTNAISCHGGIGGNGATASSGNVGGGGGGGGAGGGYIYIAYDELLGTVATDMIDCGGGDGGNGGDGFGTGIGGSGGSGGSGGRISLVNPINRSGVELIGGAGAAGSAGSGTVGGAGGAGAVLKYSL